MSPSRPAMLRRSSPLSRRPGLDSGCGAASHNSGRERPPRKDSQHNKISKQGKPSLYQTRGAAARLDALSAPPQHHADWEKLRLLINQAAANSQRQIATAERSDVTGFEQTVTITHSLTRQINQIGFKIGFTSSSPCSKVLG